MTTSSFYLFPDDQFSKKFWLACGSLILLCTLACKENQPTNTKDTKASVPSENEFIDDLSLLAPNLRSIAYINVAQLSHQSFFKQILETSKNLLKESKHPSPKKPTSELAESADDSEQKTQQKQDQNEKKPSFDIEKLWTVCHLDPLKQVRSVLIGYQDTETFEGLFIIRSEVTEQKMISCMTQMAPEDAKRMKTTKIGNGTMYQFEGEPGAFGFPAGQHRFFLGSVTEVSRVLKLSSSSPPSEILSMAQSARTAQAPVWVIGTPREQGKLRSWLKTEFHFESPLKSFFFAVDFQNRLHVTLKLTTASEGEAQKLQKEVTQKMQELRENLIITLMGLKHYFRRLKVEVQKQEVFIDFQLTPCQLEVLIEQLDSMDKSNPKANSTGASTS